LSIFLLAGPEVVSAMGTSEDTDLSILTGRVACVSRLLDHQLWEAAIGLSLDRSSASGRRFARLVEDGALLEAAVLLVGLCGPSRSIASIAMSGRNWVCVIGEQPANGDGTTRIHQAEHIDLAAAVLMALLSSRPQMRCSPHDASHRKMQGEFHDHDI